jgi:cation:H+ antiporter
MFLGGLVSLYFGAEWLVRGSASLAVRFGIRPLLVGLTIVAYGTSSPELIVSLMAAWQGQGALAVGNAVGSNIFNIAVILGLAAVIRPMRVQMQLIKADTPVMIGVALLFLIFFRDTQIQRWEALVFLSVVVLYTLVHIHLARRHASAVLRHEFSESVPKPAGSLWTDLSLIAAGLAVLMLGSRLFVAGAVDLARIWRISEAVIGLTIVSAGTSLPELASSLMAAWRRQPDIAIGNVIGSNIYNILGILGISGLLVSPLRGDGVSLTDSLVMVGLSVVLLVIAWTGFTLRRWEGGLLLAAYAGYLWHLWPAT